MTTTMTENQKAKKLVSKDEEQALELTAEVLKEGKDPLNDLANQARTTYTSYLQAQRKVAEAYQERQRQGEKAYKEVEEQATNICVETIEKASQVREKAEQEAEEEY